MKRTVHIGWILTLLVGLLPILAQAAPDQKFQFERFGYFVADRKDHAPGRPVFNKITGLKDGWK